MKTYVIDIHRLNEGGLNYLNSLFPELNADSIDDVYARLQKIEDSRIVVLNDEDLNETSSSLIRVIADVHADNGNFELEYSLKNQEGNTVVLDISALNEEGHPYLKEIFGFPDYYGNNLDALYDCLSEIDDLKIIIINMDKVNRRSLKILSVFDEVAEEFDNLHIIHEDEEEKDEENENGSD